MALSANLSVGTIINCMNFGLLLMQGNWGSTAAGKGGTTQDTAALSALNALKILDRIQDHTEEDYCKSLMAVLTRFPPGQLPPELV
jgi:hypothetical protein